LHNRNTSIRKVVRQWILAKPENKYQKSGEKTDNFTARTKVAEKS